MAQMSFTAVYMKVREGYVAFIEELPGANTQGETLEENAREPGGSRHHGPGCKPRAVRAVLEGTQVIRETLILPAA
jgi:hypothetical protein